MITPQQALNICRQHGACNYIEEIAHTWSAIIEALYTPQGIEYALTESIPIEAWRAAPRQEMRANGICIDAGEITLTRHNTPTTLYLIGNTHAHIRFTGAKLLKVILLNGASVDIYAADYAVVQIKGKGERSLTLDKTAITLDKTR